MCIKSTLNNCLFLEKNAVDLRIHIIIVADMRGRPRTTWTDNIVEWTYAGIVDARGQHKIGDAGEPL